MSSTPTRGNSATSDSVAAAVAQPSAGDSSAANIGHLPRTTTTRKRHRSATREPGAALETAPAMGSTVSNCPALDADIVSRPEGEVGAESAVGLCATAALRSRYEGMFLGDGERPRPSGGDAAATECTGGLTLDVRKVVGDLWRDRRDDIIAACKGYIHRSDGSTSIDEMDVLAWAIADTLRGGALLHADDTNKLGKRVAAKAKSVQQEITAEQRRAGDSVRSHLVDVLEISQILVWKSASRFGT